MKQSRKNYNAIEDDDMGSYGLHPLVHQKLVSCHNPARNAESAPPTLISEREQRLRELVFQRVDAEPTGADQTLSA